MTIILNERHVDGLFGRTPMFLLFLGRQLDIPLHCVEQGDHLRSDHGGFHVHQC